MKKRIVTRKKIGSKTIRVLECEHEVIEPVGGKAHLAQAARCPQCAAGKVSAPETVVTRTGCRGCNKEPGPLCDTCWLNGVHEAWKSKAVEA